jgi:hypothetical protein
MLFLSVSADKQRLLFAMLCMAVRVCGCGFGCFGCWATDLNSFESGELKSRIVQRLIPVTNSSRVRSPLGGFLFSSSSHVLCSFLLQAT